MRSQTPSPHQKLDTFRSSGGMYGSGSTQTSMEQVYPGVVDHARGPSPYQEFRGPSPTTNSLLDKRGPFPNPGPIAGMKTPFYSSAKTLNFPLFQLNVQRRWSEASAGEVRGADNFVDVEAQMRRWSMPWEVLKTERNTVTWQQTRIMPGSKPSRPTSSKANSDRSQSTTPDSVWPTCQKDGLDDAIHLLSLRPQSYKLNTQQSFPTFVEEPVSIYFKNYNLNFI